MDIEPLNSPSSEVFQSRLQQAWNEAESGQLISEDELKTQMSEFKKTWKEYRAAATK